MQGSRSLTSAGADPAQPSRSQRPSPRPGTSCSPKAQVPSRPCPCSRASGKQQALLSLEVSMGRRGQAGWLLRQAGWLLSQADARGGGSFHGVGGAGPEPLHHGVWELLRALPDEGRRDPAIPWGSPFLAPLLVCAALPPSKDPSPMPSPPPAPPGLTKQWVNCPSVLCMPSPISLCACRSRLPPRGSSRIQQPGSWWGAQRMTQAASGTAVDRESQRCPWKEGITQC